MATSTQPKQRLHPFVFFWGMVEICKVLRPPTFPCGFWHLLRPQFLLLSCEVFFRAATFRIRARSQRTPKRSFFGGIFAHQRAMDTNQSFHKFLIGHVRNLRRKLCINKNSGRLDDISETHDHCDIIVNHGTWYMFLFQGHRLLLHKKLHGKFNRYNLCLRPKLE